jgi:hypothetical protein
MTIKTRIAYMNGLEVPMNWLDKWDGMSPSTRLYITTDKPASEMSIEELLELIEVKKEQAVVKKALAQYYEAVEILKAFGAEIESEIIGLDSIEWLKDEGE